MSLLTHPPLPTVPPLEIYCCHGVVSLTQTRVPPISSVTIVGAVRFFFLYRNNALPRRPDSMFSIGYTTSAIETNLAIITGSAPALWPLGRRWCPCLFRGLGLSRGYQGHIGDIEATFDPSTGTTNTSCKDSLKKTLPTGWLTWRIWTCRTRGGPSSNSGVGRNSFSLSNLPGNKSAGRTELRGHTPKEGEEEIMTYNGVVRVLNSDSSEGCR